MLRKGDLTQGGITGTLLHFTLPMMVGSFLQQCYNIADTLIVGQCIGAGALAAVGSAYTLMVFLISVLLGLAMGSGTVFSLHYGAGNHVNNHQIEYELIPFIQLGSGVISRIKSKLLGTTSL